MSPVIRFETRIITAAIGCPPQPRVDLFRVARSVGVDDSQIHATRFHNGFTDFRTDRPNIYLNKAETGPRMRFTLAHEIAHVIFRLRNVRDIVAAYVQGGFFDAEEEMADSVAETLLMPDRWIDALRKVRPNLVGLQRIAKLVDVPLAVLIKRMSAASIDIGLLHWVRGQGSWYIVDRPGLPQELSGQVKLSRAAKFNLDNIGLYEDPVAISGWIGGRRIEVSGTGYMSAGEVYQLVRPSKDVWISPEKRVASAGWLAIADSHRDGLRRGDISTSKTRSICDVPAARFGLQY